MSRGLTAGQIGILENRSNVVEFLVKITGLLNTYFYTTGSSDVTFDGDTYLVNNGIRSMTEIYGEDSQITGTPFAIALETTNTSLITDLAGNLSRNRNTVSVFLLTRDASTKVADTTNVIQLYSGVLDSASLTTDNRTQVLNMSFTNQIGIGFDNVLGRKMNSLTKLSGYAVDKTIWG